MTNSKATQITRETIQSAIGVRVSVSPLVSSTFDGHSRFQVSGMTRNVVAAAAWLSDNGIAVVESKADGEEEEDGPDTSIWVVAAL